MHRRLLKRAAVVLLLFALWSLVAWTTNSNGRRASVWIPSRYGDWPETVDTVKGGADMQLAMFATFAPTPGAPPAGVPDMFGHPGLGGDIDPADSEHINGTRYLTGLRAGPLVSVSVFVPGPVDAAPHDQYQLAVYDDVNGAPRHLLATTAAGTLVAGTWNTMSIDVTLQPKTAYWLMYNSNGTNESVNNLTFTPISGDILDDFIRSKTSDEWRSRVDVITSAGGQVPMVIAIAAVCLIAARRRLRSGLVLGVGFAATLLVASVMRFFVFAPYGAYPSGHALRTVYLAVAVSFIFPWRSVRLASIAAVIVVCVAAVYAGGHYSDEIIGGLLLGWGMATAAVAVASWPTRTPPIVEPDASGDLVEDIGASMG